ncbi:MAG TPA: hypothetical protein VK826_06990 [Bacteroidia bacterium]|nr:hypothetical protein [Bacteroidia bacterium]
MINSHVGILNKELEWLDRIIQHRYDQTIARLKKPDQNDNGILSPAWPKSCSPQDLLPEENGFAQFVHAFNLVFEERLLLALSMAVHLDPYFFTARRSRLEQLDQRDGQIGFGAGMLNGVRYNGLVPSGHTYLLLAAGNNIDLRFKAAHYLSAERPLFRKKVLHLEQAQDSDPIYLGKIILAHAYFETFIGMRVHNFTENVHG